MKISTINLMTTAMLIAATFFGSIANAQTTSSMASSPNPWRFGIGFETGIPTRSLERIANWGIGGTARLQYNASSSVGIMLTSGYYNYFSSSKNGPVAQFGNSYYATNQHDLGIIPVKLGIKTYLNTNGLYLTAEGGVGFETSYNEDKKLILAPGIGWADSSWDVSARYENFSGQSNNYGTVGLRIAYGFSL